MEKRDTYKYYVKQGNKILDTGITNNLELKIFKNRQKYGDTAQVQQVGRAVTRKSGYKWAYEQLAKGKSARA